MRKLVLPDRPIWPSIPSSQDLVGTVRVDGEVPLEQTKVTSQATDLVEKHRVPPRTTAEFEGFGSFSI